MVYAKRQRIEVFMDAVTSKTLTSRFGYCFEQAEGSLYPAILKDNRINAPYQEISVNGAGGTISAMPFRQIHGNIDSLGFRFGNVAYSSDISDIPEESNVMLEDLDCWIIDALRDDPHPTHFNLDRALAEIERFKPKKAILTNLHVDLDYRHLCNVLPKNVVPAFDGLEYS
jgi:phosphoribosyl 1,2-cyclic phosphate phosphodiesterase